MLRSASRFRPRSTLGVIQWHTMAVLRKRKSSAKEIAVKNENSEVTKSKYFKERVKVKKEREVDISHDRDYVDINWVKSLDSENYFKWIVSRNGNVPNRWSQPFDDTIFTDLDEESFKLLPKNFPEIYKKMRWMRSFIRAPVDLIGGSSIPMTVGEMCGIKKSEILPRNYRLQVLVGVMLSAQTKDEVTAMGMYNIMKYCIEELKDAQGITLDALLRIDEQVLDELIHSVGFHKRKANFIKRTAAILNEKYDQDVPDNVTDILGLPGVGPKMGYLTLQKAWGKIEGICVDVHVDRLCKMWKWVDPDKCKTPNDTRKQLQKWLPPRLWTEINGLLVGFGQVIGKSRGANFDIFRVNIDESKQRQLTEKTFTTLSNLNESIRSNITSYRKWMGFLMKLDLKKLENDMKEELDVSIVEGEQNSMELKKEPHSSIDNKLDVGVKLEESRAINVDTSLKSEILIKKEPDTSLFV